MCMVADLVAAELGAKPAPAAATPRAPRAAATLSRRQLEDILFDTCTGCSHSQTQTDMSAIPQGVLAVRAVAANRAKTPESNMSEIAFEHPLLKYNSKLMNSIWGLYNRYSVHNFKKNNSDGEIISLNLGSQQQVLMATAAAPLNGALLESLWLQ